MEEGLDINSEYNLSKYGCEDILELEIKQCYNQYVLLDNDENPLLDFCSVNSVYSLLEYNPNLKNAIIFLNKCFQQMVDVKQLWRSKRFRCQTLLDVKHV